MVDLTLPSSSQPSRMTSPTGRTRHEGYPKFYSRRRTVLQRDTEPLDPSSSSSSSSSSQEHLEEEDSEDDAYDNGCLYQESQLRQEEDHEEEEPLLHQVTGKHTRHGTCSPQGKHQTNDHKLRVKEPMVIRMKKVCKVCKQTGHQAGFLGATYIDCPEKPCFLCKLPGHTTISCPYRVAGSNGVTFASDKSTLTSLEYVFHRQLRAKVHPVKQTYVIPNQVDSGIIRYHSRRITCLEFHATRNGILLSGDKKGQLGVWNYRNLHEKTIYEHIHTCILNNMKLNSTKDGVLYTSSSDGAVSCTDLETGISSQLMNLNPDGWHDPASWRMLYGLDINTEKGLVCVADNFGYLYMVDVRSKSTGRNPVLIHKRGTKVVGLHCNPVLPDLLLSCGNDHFARIWDMRKLEVSLGDLAHDRVVNSAYFSPITGSKILSTSQDNRIRVWDSVFRDLSSATREIVHSHDFNRHLTSFRAEWDPKDSSESLAVIGRYISENYNGVALHPIDFIDTNTGQLVAEVTEPEITTISPVNKFHPTEDILATGSSRSIFIWKPKDALTDDRSMKFKKEMAKGKSSEGSDNDDDFAKCKKSKVIRQAGKQLKYNVKKLTK